jgi:hypothetical protein
MSALATMSLSLIRKLPCLGFLYLWLTLNSENSFHIERIISHNSFGCPTLSSYHSTQQMLLEGNIAETKMHHSTGIWLKASKVNHSCMANCKRSFIRDLQIIRVTQDILANTELFFWYREPTCDYADMKKEM